MRTAQETRKTKETDIFERYPAGTETGITSSEAWQRRKKEGGSSIKRKFSERGENYERRNNDHLFCILMRGVSWNGRVY